MRHEWVLGMLLPLNLVLTGCSSSATNEATPNDAQATADDAGCVAFDGGLDSVAVAAGQALVGKWQCASCHQGDSGTLGGGTYSLDGGTMAYPPNLTPDQETGLGCWSDKQIETAVSTGIDNEGAPLCVMPQFAIDAGSMHQIVAYLRSLPSVSNQVPDTNCP